MQQLHPIRPDLHYRRPESLAGALQAWTLTTSPDEMRDMSSVEYQKTNSTTFGKLSGKGLYQDDYWLRAVTTWNFLQLYLCWNYIFLASSEYIDLEMNFKSERVYIFTIRWYFALCWARLSLVLKESHHFTIIEFSSPRAESARAVTGRWCPHSGEGEDFLMGQLNFFLRKLL